MREIWRFVVCLATLALAACATVDTTALESQSKQRAARQARLYFIWPKGWMQKTGTVGIKIDERLVGKLAPNTYFFVDRPPGAYTLKVQPVLGSSFETEVQVAAGGTYHYGIHSGSTYAPLSGGAFVSLHHHNPGEPMQPKGGGLSFAHFKLNSLDAALAAAAMAKLDAAR